ncbi:hypothetical protein A2482_03645 [Candidatus Falkowbacteria bacterium RIFOXYC2_FULL_48_21]|uniref:Band 7 domain-containing protein n=1 Tax=Candidatus Falkowbacteria bacterium RIFOXYC2_FULL_48_21 TaxID=1798005 RepID=A0A1F5TAA4_9BACT|nr:MAG: hypothetical protein A2482_03645 [Candidatus Falkowbacteria bacterium RIFOXYC2_FULL_48_21]
MSLTEIGIIGLLTTLFIGWLFMSIVVTRTGKLTIIGEWGANACDVLKPGVCLIFWPLRQVMKKISISTRTMNIAKFIVNTLMEDAAAGPVSFRENEVVPLVPGEVSVMYHLDFFQPRSDMVDRRKLDGYFKLRTVNGFEYAKAEEIIKDKTQSCIREIASRLGALTVMSWPPTMTVSVREKIADLLNEQHIPITIMSLHMNTPFTFANPEHAKAVAAKATAVLQLDAVDKEQDVLEREADRQIGIKRKQGEAEGEMEKIKLRKLFESYGIDELPPTHRFLGRLSVGALRAYEKLTQSPNKTFTISSSIMDEIRSMLSRMGKD